VADNKRLISLISDHEGLKLKVYDDATGQELKSGDILIGHPTIGVGRNVAKDGLGISQEEAEFMLMNDIERVEEEIKNFPIEHLNEVRTAIIIDMAFNMGITRFNPTMWKKTFQAIVDEDWQKAKIEMLDSNWARQTKRRSVRLSQMMLLGTWIV
jgi:lysozyme